MPCSRVSMRRIRCPSMTTAAARISVETLWSSTISMRPGRPRQHERGGARAHARIGAEHHGEPEARTGAGALRPRFRRPSCGELAADGKAQAGAAVAPGERGIGLRKRLEQALAHGMDMPMRCVGDGEFSSRSRRPARPPVDRHQHVALSVNLMHCDQVGENLPPGARRRRIATPAGRGRCARQLRCPSVRAGWQAGSTTSSTTLARIEAVLLEFERCRPRFSRSRECRDDRQQGVTGVVHRLHKTLWLIRQRRVEQQLGLPRMRSSAYGSRGSCWRESAIFATLPAFGRLFGPASPPVFPTPRLRRVMLRPTRDSLERRLVVENRVAADGGFHSSSRFRSRRRYSKSWNGTRLSSIALCSAIRLRKRR